MKYKILSILCVLCILAGCKIELPEQAASNGTAESTASSQVSSAFSSTANSALNSAAESSAQSSSALPVSSAVTASSAANTVSKSASSPAVPKAPAVSKPAVPAASQPQEKSCTLAISCSDILKNSGRFNADQLSIVPKDGVIYAEKSIPIQDGDTVFDVLLRETKANHISMVHANSLAFQTEYVQSIDNIKEKDFGSTSGWMYVVNGKQPPVGCSSYKLKSGDKVQWIYQCGN